MLQVNFWNKQQQQKKWECLVWFLQNRSTLIEHLRLACVLDTFECLSMDGGRFIVKLGVVQDRQSKVFGRDKLTKRTWWFMKEAGWSTEMWSKRQVGPKYSHRSCQTHDGCVWKQGQIQLFTLISCWWCACRVPQVLVASHTGSLLGWRTRLKRLKGNCICLNDRQKSSLSLYFGKFSWTGRRRAEK